MKINCKALIIFLSIFFSYKYSIAQFREIYSGNINNDAHGMYFFNVSTGFVTFSNYIGFTQDSGHTYSGLYVTPTNIDLNGVPTISFTTGFTPSGVYAFSIDTLFAYGHFSAEPSILYTADRGLTWKLVWHAGASNSDLYNKIFDLQFAPNNRNIGFAVQHDRILKTHDKGQTWTIEYYPSNTERLSVPSRDTLYVVGGSNIFKSINQGTSWFSCNNPLGSSGGGSFSNVSFLTSNIGYVLESSSSRVYRTNDGGNSWTKMNNDTLNPVTGSDMVFINDSTGFICNQFLYQVYKTSNRGKLWEPCKKNTNYQYLGYGFNRLFFLNSNIGWASGAGEYLMLSTTGTPVLPKAFFNIQSAYSTYFTYNINLQNYSNPNYQCSWYKNDTLISTTFNAGYVHTGYPLTDTIKLIVSNGIESDTSVKYVTFSVPPPIPIINSFSPTSAVAYQQITIRGKYFTGVNAISFGGVPGYYYQVINDSFMYGYPSTGASGDISISKTGAPAGSISGFTFLKVPTILSVSPLYGSIGSIVTITGTNFSNLIPDNIVYFGAVRAEVLTCKSDTITVRVPPGASYGPVSVNVKSIIALSANYFQVSFPNAIFNTGTYPTKLDIQTQKYPSIVIGDFDIDGKPDIIVATKSSDTLCLYKNISINNGLVKFDPPKYIRLDNYSSSRIISSDFDGDGLIDIAVTDQNNIYPYPSMDIRKNISTPGNINFDSYSNDYSTTSDLYDINPESMAVEDFDGNGKIDVAVANLYDKNIKLMLNNSHLTDYQFQGTTINVGSTPYSVGLKDITGDGKPDLIVGSGAGKLVVYKNTGSNHTAAPVYFNGPTFPRYLSTADLDGDGKFDIAVTDYTYGKIFLYRNMSDTATVLFDTTGRLVCDKNPSSIAIGDVNGDGKPDLLISNTGSDSISVFINTSTIGNLSFNSKVDFKVGSGPVSIFLADLNGDGFPEIICANTVSNSISILDRNGSIPLATCPSSTTTNITSNVSGSSYQWQLDNGGGFIDIVDNANFTGSNVNTLQIHNMDSSWYGYKFRCVTDLIPGPVNMIKFTSTWIGTVSNYWNNPANWSCGILPGPTTDVYINPRGHVEVTGNVIIGSLNVAPTANVTIDSGVNVRLTH